MAPLTLCRYRQTQKWTWLNETTRTTPSIITKVFGCNRESSVLRWVLTSMGILGALLNASGNGMSFAIWAVANVGLIVVSVKRQEWPEVVLFCAYLGTSIYGMYSWGMI